MSLSTAAKLSVSAILFVGIILLLPRDASSCKEQYKSDVTVSDVFHAMRLDAQLASTEIDRELGLSGKECISENQAMLFEFDSPGYYGIWMKEMKFPIDIVWLDEQKTVVHIEAGISPGSFPYIYTPKSRSTYVMELRDGTADQYGLGVGSRLSW